MNGNVCDDNLMDENVLPPPRKRLLAGFKKQNENISDRSHGSTSASPPTTPTEVVSLKNMLSYHASKCSGNSSLKDIVESSEKAAKAAVKVAEAARAMAEEKAAVAARAIAVAKSALELVEVFSDRNSSRDRDLKRNKSKKQVTVHSLYKKRDEVDNGKTDEAEIKSNKAMYTPPSLYKHSPPSADSKGNKHKKPKVSPVIGKPEFLNEGSLEENLNAICDGKSTLYTEGCSHEVAAALDNEKRSQCLTKLLSSNWRVEKDIVSHRRKARKQLMSMVKSQQGMQLNILQARSIADQSSGTSV